VNSREPLTYGIDIGMSSSVVAVGLRDGTVEVVADPLAAPDDIASMPTAVCVLPDGRISVGHAAEQDQLHHPEHFRREFKREIAAGGLIPIGPGQTVSVTSVVGAVLRQLRELARSAHPGEPDHVVITVPAGWERTEQQRMRAAAREAGFRPETVELLGEPAAAAQWAASSDLVAADGPMLVYDLGGSTFACAVTAADGTGRLLGTEELLDVGGTDFDRAMFSLLRAAEEPPDDLDIAGQLRLDTACRDVKHALSVVTTVELPAAHAGTARGCEISRAEFEKQIGPLIQRTTDVCDSLVRNLRLRWTDLAAVLLVGGSSRIPLVHQRLEALAPGRVVLAARPELVVAIGAARFRLPAGVPDGRRALAAEQPAVPLGPPAAEGRPAVPAGQPPQVAAPSPRLVDRDPRVGRAPRMPSGTAQPAATQPVARRRRSLAAVVLVFWLAAVALPALVGNDPMWWVTIALAVVVTGAAVLVRRARRRSSNA